jgi:hypothetical protein
MVVNSEAYLQTFYGVEAKSDGELSRGGGDAHLRNGIV